MLVLRCCAEDDEAERDYSLRSCYMKGEDGAVPSGQVGSCANLHGFIISHTQQDLVSMQSLRSGRPLTVLRAWMCASGQWRNQPFRTLHVALRF